MSTLQEIEAAVESLPRAEQEILYAHLTARLSVTLQQAPASELGFLARAQAIWGAAADRAVTQRNRSGSKGVSVIYLDTGCLVKLFYPEPNSLAVTELVLKKTIIFTDLHALEMTTAFQLKRFRGEATEGQTEAAWESVNEVLESAKLVRVPVNWAMVLNHAAELARSYTVANGCRSLDVLHCALAVKLKVEEFVSTDARQLAMAQAIGLRSRSVSKI